MMADPEVTRFLGDGRPLNEADVTGKLALILLGQLDPARVRALGSGRARDW